MHAGSWHSCAAAAWQVPRWHWDQSDCRPNTQAHVSSTSESAVAGCRTCDCGTAAALGYWPMQRPTSQAAGQPCTSVPCLGQVRCSTHLAVLGARRGFRAASHAWELIRAAPKPDHDAAARSAAKVLGCMVAVPAVCGPSINAEQLRSRAWLSKHSGRQTRSGLAALS